MGLDCGITTSDLWFRYRVGAIIVQNGFILLAKTEGETFYYTVGGGVQIGEEAKHAAEREALEETGIPYEAERLVFIHENFFYGEEGILKGKQCHEICFYYLMKPQNTMEITVDSYTHGMKEKMHWIPTKELDKYKVFPGFLSAEILNLPTEVKHIVTHE